MLSKLVYCSGFASTLGGLLFGVAVVLHPLRNGMRMLEIVFGKTTTTRTWNTVIKIGAIFDRQSKLC